MDFNSDDGDVLVSAIRLNIQRLSSKIRELESTVPSVNDSSDDGERRREQFNTLAKESNALAKETNMKMQQLVKLANNNRQMKVQQERLSDDFIQMLNRLRAVQYSAERAQKEGVRRAKLQQQLDEEESRRQRQAEDYGIGLQMQQQQQRQHIEEYKERQQNLAQLEQDIQDVNSIFSDLASIVHEQGDMVDSIEENVERAHVHVETGATQLRQAVYYQTKAREKKLMFCIFLLILAGIVGVTLYFWVKK